MTKARDLSNIISSGVPNNLINLDANEIPSLDASKITTGTFADARISNSSVSQHAQSFDDNKIINDISTLALRSATSENAIAYNTNSSFIDVFQDATGIDTTTNTSRNVSEYVSSRITVVNTPTINTSTFTDATGNYSTLNSTGTYWRNYGAGGALGGSVAMYTGGGNNYLEIPNDNTFIHQMGSSDFTVEMFIRDGQTSSHRNLFGYADSGTSALQISTNPTNSIYVWGSKTLNNWDFVLAALVASFGNGVWKHIALVREGSNFSTYYDGARQSLTSVSGSLVDENSALRIFANLNVPDSFDGYIDQFAISNTARYSGSSYTVPSGSTGYAIDSNHKLIIGSYAQSETFNATGNFTGTTITASSNVSSMGAIITYQDQAGTNALNTDIVLELSADNGSNWSTATLSALPNFATGIKMAKVNDLAVTAGTQLKYRLNFANQASGSKEARIRGVSLQY